MKQLRLEGRAAIITGGSQGLGLAIAQAFAAEGARIAICGRDEASLQEARRVLGSDVLAVRANVASPDDVESLVAEAVSAFGGVDVLVNNAGIHGPKGPFEETDWDEWRAAIEVNLLGSVLLCRAVVPHMKRRGYGKIIQISGGGATKPMPRMSAYAASKAASVRFAETIAEELKEHRISVNALAPGALNTRLLDDVLTAGPERVGEEVYARALAQQTSGGQSIEEAAACAVFLASAESDGITGKLISAPWDPWRELPSRAEEMRGSDIYTLRRVVPDWGSR